MSGCSSAANSDAEYIDAPASLTITYWVFKFSSFIKSAIIFSDSLDAVPFPIAITSISYFFTKSKTFFLADSILACGLCGYTIAWSKNLPFLSTTAILHPFT